MSSIIIITPPDLVSGDTQSLLNGVAIQLPVVVLASALAVEQPRLVVQEGHRQVVTTRAKVETIAVVDHVVLARLQAVPAQLGTVQILLIIITEGTKRVRLAQDKVCVCVWGGVSQDLRHRAFEHAS